MHSMPDDVATLHLIAGKIGSGKSTLAARLGGSRRTVVISEDQWLAALYGDVIHSVADYARYAERLRNAMEPHVIGLLGNGLSVVLDFPANTVAVRSWMHTLVSRAGCAHRLHYLDVPDDICHPFSATEEQFDRITQHFVEPSADEGFDIVLYRHDEADG
jgi:predicted kinase